jgi:hypothetical protein
LAGLPDFSWSKHTKTGKNGHKIYQHFPFKGPPKFTQIWDFWFENKPSGNPAFWPILVSLGNAIQIWLFFKLARWPDLVVSSPPAIEKTGAMTHRI